MVAPSRTPTISANNNISAGLTHDQQFQELFYQLKAWLVASGGTVLRSNGSVSGTTPTAGAADYITARNTVTIGAAGTGAWVVIEFASSTISVTSAHRVLLYVDDTAPARTIGFRAGPGTWASGSTSALPTLTGLATTTTFYLHPDGSNPSLYYSTWRTASPARPQRFMCKLAGIARANLVIELVSNTGANGSGDERWAWRITTYVGASDVNAPASYQSTAVWSAIDAAASLTTTTKADSTIWSLSSNWTAGRDGSSKAHPDIIRVGQDVADGRTIGTIVDSYALPALFNFGDAVDQDEVTNAQDPLRVSFGAVAWYWPNGTGIS